MAAPAASHSLDLWMKIAIGIFVPFSIFYMTSLRMSLDKLEERQFNFQGSAVTSVKLTQTENKIINYVDVRMGDIASKVDSISAQQAKTNDLLLNLASGMNKKK